MNEQVRRTTEQFINAAKEGRIPENVQEMAREGVAKSREAYEKMSVAAQDQAKVTEELFRSAQAGAKVIGTKMLDNTTANADAAFEAASQIARAKSVPEAARIQAEFVQKQLAVAGAQTKELFDLSTRIMQDTFQSMNVAATRSFEQAKKSV